MNFFYGFALTVISFAVAPVAYIVTLTTNPEAIGGYLPFVFFTLSPILFFFLGLLYSTEEENDSDRIEFEIVSRAKNERRGLYGPGRKLGLFDLDDSENIEY